jgi:hypothetical protein
VRNFRTNIIIERGSISPTNSINKIIAYHMNMSPVRWQTLWASWTVGSRNGESTWNMYTSNMYDWSYVPTVALVPRAIVE